MHYRKYTAFSRYLFLNTGVYLWKIISNKTTWQCVSLINIKSVENVIAMRLLKMFSKNGRMEEQHILFFFFCDYVYEVHDHRDGKQLSKTVCSISPVWGARAVGSIRRFEQIDRPNCLTDRPSGPECPTGSRLDRWSRSSYLTKKEFK